MALAAIFPRQRLFMFHGSLLLLMHCIILRNALETPA